MADTDKNSAREASACNGACAVDVQGSTDGSITQGEMDTNRIQIHQLQDFLRALKDRKPLPASLSCLCSLAPSPALGTTSRLIPWAGEGPDCKAEIQMGTPTVLRHGWIQPHVRGLSWLSAAAQPGSTGSGFPTLGACCRTLLLPLPL